MTAPEVFVVRDRELLLEAVAARLVTRLVDHQAAAGSARESTVISRVAPLGRASVTRE